MTFLDIALRNAARGFRVLPLNGKAAVLKDWPQLATTNRTTIEQWAAKWPDANCGVAGGPDVIGLDTDRLDRLRQLCVNLPPETFVTFGVTSGRENRAHFYYKATPEALSLGNMKWAEPGINGNVFEVKGDGAYLVGEGSIHPDTQQTYTVTQDLPPADFPPALAARLRELHGRAEKRERIPREKVTEGGRRNALVQEAGRILRVTEMSKAILLAHLQEFNEQWLEPPLSSEEVRHVAENCNWEPEPPEPTLIICSSAVQPEPASLPQHNRPIYAIEVWEGTAMGEFAKLCAHDNNIPRKLYAEAFRCVLGAVLGDRISCHVEGALPRSYTVIIAPKGKGKGTAIRRAVKFFSSQWYSLSTSPGLLSGERDFIWKSQGIGAWNTAASSVPGMARLCKDLEKTLKNSPHMAWGNTLPRILSVHEEMKTFLSTLFIEGGVGSGMEGVICQLWDDVSFNGTATGTREAAYGEMLFSLLAGVTEDDWFDLLSRGDAVGGGLMSRFNLIGTEGKYENVSRMSPPDFSQLQESFLPRVRLLADAKTTILPTEGADKVISEWTEKLPEGSERMNVHVWRSALMLAWLRREETITPKTAEDAVCLGQYQADSHAYYRVKATEGQNARVQAKIIRTLEMKGPQVKRDLQQRTHASRCGTEVWARALEGLLKDKRVGRREDGALYLSAE